MQHRSTFGTGWARCVTVVVLAVSLRSYALPTAKLPGKGLAERVPASSGTTTRGQSLVKQPNIVFIMTDDQDYHYNSTHKAYMPALNQYLIEAGMTLKNFFVSSPECCPSRTTYFLGRYSHNHNVTSPQPPHGAYPKFRANSLDDDYLPGWLQEEGYSTYYLGKFLNSYVPARDTHPPYNWTWIEALVAPWIYTYYNPVLSRDGGEPKPHPGVHQSDLLASRAELMIDDAVKRKKPFYMQVAPAAPHDAIEVDLTNLANPFVGFIDPKPARRHAGLYADVTLPRLPNTNEEDMGDKCSLLRALPRLNATQLERLNEYYRNRLRALRGVDEMLGRVVKRLEQRGVLDNTYLIFTSDNGFHMGAHRLGSGKLLPFEEDTRVPFYVRGPGIAPGSINLQMSTMVDLAPTVMTLASAPLPHGLDGAPIRLFGADARVQPAAAADNSGRESVLVETWGFGGDQIFQQVLHNSTMRAVRVCNTEAGMATVAGSSSGSSSGGPGRKALEGQEGSSDAIGAGAATTAWPQDTLYGAIGDELGRGRDITAGAHRQLAADVGSSSSSSSSSGSSSSAYCWKYVAWCTGERDVYDLLADPWELQNQYKAYRTTPSRQRLMYRLEAVLSAMHACSGASCMEPYKTIHGADSTVSSLQEAMAPQYDKLYSSLPQYKYYTCLEYYSDQNEVSWAEGKLHE